MKKILSEQIDKIKPSAKEIKEIKKIVGEFSLLLKSKIKKSKIKADVFLGGSFAKNTLMKKKEYDIDIFVRFDKKYENISETLGKLLKGMNFERVHGSRDYFRLRRGSLIIEVIPVIKISSPREAENVTDLSYFHVSYVKKKIAKLESEVLLAKQFCEAQGVYGAESYINGFSGYGLECLIIYYKKFDRMLKELAKVNESLVIDIEKKYKNKQEILFLLNAAKIKGPIVLVDPTARERNVLAALNWETFRKFQDAARSFLKKPNAGFFEIKDFDVEAMKNRAKKNNNEFVQVNIETDRQEGDIAGTKLKKFHYFVEKEVKKFFDLKEHHFEYLGGKKAVFYLATKRKNEILRNGPPVEMKKEAEKFRSVHKNAFVKNKKLYAKIPIKFTLKEFLSDFAKDKKINQMAITRMSV